MAKGSLQREKDRKIENYLRKGKPYAFIAGKLGVSHSRIAMIKHMAGMMEEKGKQKNKFGGSAGEQPPT